MIHFAFINNIDSVYVCQLFQYFLLQGYLTNDVLEKTFI